MCSQFYHASSHGFSKASNMSSLLWDYKVSHKTLTAGPRDPLLSYCWRKSHTKPPYLACFWEIPLCPRDSIRIPRANRKLRLKERQKVYCWAQWKRKFGDVQFVSLPCCSLKLLVCGASASLQHADGSDRVNRGSMPLHMPDT